MTIINPHKKQTIFRLLFVMFGILILGGGFYIVEYNTLANIRHEVLGMKNNLAALQVENAELKNTLYATIDSVKLETLATRFALTLDTHPEYLNITTHTWPSDSSR